MQLSRAFRRLIGKKQAGMIYQGAGDGGALLLASRG